MSGRGIESVLLPIKGALSGGISELSVLIFWDFDEGEELDWREVVKGEMAESDSESLSKGSVW